VAWTSRADRIDRDGPDLLYQQVADDIAAMVKSEELPRGSRLPAEHELMAIYAVSRPTVRSAVAELSKAGVVTVVRGRGHICEAIGAVQPKSERRQRSGHSSTLDGN
jgi:DNA-binding GntR family transcriptional regulator